MFVRDLLKTKGTAVVTARGTDTVETILRLLASRRIGAVPVLDGEQVVGMLAERDLIRLLAEQGPSVLHQRANAVMEHRIPTCRLATPVRDIMALMTRGRIRHVLVVEDGTLHGIVSIGDIVKQRLQELETEANVLRDHLVARTAYALR